MAERFSRDVCVIGGGGRVGLPLALMFADAGLRTVIFDVNQPKVEQIRSGRMPFLEEGADALLTRTLAAGTLEVEYTPRNMDQCKFLVLIIGTPIDEHLNPTFSSIQKSIEQCEPHLRPGQIIILRSTIFPGISRHVQDYLDSRGHKVHVAFCPERVAQGHSLREFRELPQIISACDPDALAEVRKLFSRFTAELVEMEPMEAELCKLMTNAWRYIQFATVNQFYMIATKNDLDFNRILHGCRYKYPRMASMPGPGFAAGPCLVKDAMQLAAFSQNNFVLGHAAMLINEGLPAHLIELAKREVDLRSCTAGILGMAFKADSDDPRDSLSYKLRKLLRLEAKRVVCSDPLVPGDDFIARDQLLAEADVIFVGTPHSEYRGLKAPEGKLVVDVWNVLRR